MALELIDPRARLKFIPQCEKGADNPTTFYIKPEGVRESLLYKRLQRPKFKIGMDGPELQCLENTEDENWLEYLLSRLTKIENVLIGGELKSIEGRSAILNCLEMMPNARQIGAELFAFMRTHADLMEDQAKN